MISKAGLVTLVVLAAVKETRCGYPDYKEMTACPLTSTLGGTECLDGGRACICGGTKVKGFGKYCCNQEVIRENGTTIRDLNSTECTKGEFWNTKSSQQKMNCSKGEIQEFTVPCNFKCRAGNQGYYRFGCPGRCVTWFDMCQGQG